jgi:MoaA/NifB/PqqE/SkfB family radical SAM enzyme
LDSRLINLSATRAVENINITGGEPFHPLNLNATLHTVNTVKNLWHNSIISINTNAVGIDDKIIRWISSSVDYLKVSLYGLSNEEYRWYTGVPCMDHVIETIRKMTQLGIKIKLNVIANKFLLNKKQMLNYLTIAKEMRTKIKFVEIVTEDWFSVTKMYTCLDLHVDAERVLLNLLDLGAVIKGKSFDRFVLEYDGVNVEVYRYSNNDTWLSGVYEKNRWGEFLRTDGRHRRILIQRCVGQNYCPEVTTFRDLGFESAEIAERITI